VRFEHEAAFYTVLGVKECRMRECTIWQQVVEYIVSPLPPPTPFFSDSDYLVDSLGRDTMTGMRFR